MNDEQMECGVFYDTNTVDAVSASSKIFDLAGEAEVEITDMPAQFAHYCHVMGSINGWSDSIRYMYGTWSLA